VVDYEQILYERRGVAALVTLNRPEKLNAWTGRMQTELRNAIERANADDDVAAIIFTGAGRGYCAGADIGAWRQSLAEGPGPAAGAGRNSGEFESWVRVVRKAKPIIAAINGVAVGVGLTHVLPADIRIAGQSARFGAIFARMGLVPELASSYYLVQLIGLGAAQELCLTTRIIDADEARELGLVSKVVPDDQLLDEAFALATSIAGLPGPQLRIIKTLFDQNATDADTDAVQAREGEALQRAYATSEFREAVTAFSEKRQPNFRAVVAGR
jgi:enoyl-CoA hydratase/carnithine racemase